MARKKDLPVYVSLDEAAEMMSLSTRTIRRRISDGTIPAYQCGRRPIRIRLDELEAALRRIPSAHGPRRLLGHRHNGALPSLFIKSEMAAASEA